MRFLLVEKSLTLRLRPLRPPLLRLCRLMCGGALPCRSQALNIGALPLVRPLAQTIKGQARTRGTAPIISTVDRQGIALPHIRRRSRCEPSCRGDAKRVAEKMRSELPRRCEASCRGDAKRVAEEMNRVAEVMNRVAEEMRTELLRRCEASC